MIQMRRDEPKPLSTREIVDADPPPASERTSTPAIEPPRAVQQAPPLLVSDSAHDVLFPSEESTGYRSRWEAIQTRLRRRAARRGRAGRRARVAGRDRLAEVFGREREALEQQGRGGNVSTEDLRIALKPYRTFFDRLLSVSQRSWPRTEDDPGGKLQRESPPRARHEPDVRALLL
jgi:hypothetical protein